MASFRPCLAVRLTPPATGAIASLGVFGDDARQIVSRCLRPARGRPFADRPANTPVFGYWSPPGSGRPAEHVVAAAPSARLVEIHCHGSPAAVEAILADLERVGCRRVGQREWLEAVEPDRLAAAARLALAAAPTRRAAAILLDQQLGALRRELAQAAALVQRRDEQAAGALEQLERRGRVGVRLTNPWRVVLAGPPNAGKSSLLNAIAGYQRAIVHPTPGVTRDALCVAAAVDGWPVQLVDTAGLRTAADPVEREAVRIAREQMAQADLVLLVFDASLVWSSDQQRLADAAPPATLIVHNKSDLPPGAGQRPAGLRGSARTGDGLDKLLAAVAQSLVPDPPPPGAATPFTAEQLEAIAEARRAVTGGRWKEAAQRLLALLQ